VISPSIPASVRWGAVFGALVVLLPLGLWWLDAATVHAVAIAVIASAYIGFAVADGRPRVIVVESVVAIGFFVIAAIAITGWVWLIVIGYFLHGSKDLWQHRSHYVANTRWWPPFCMVVDWIAAAVIAIEIVAGVSFHS
jgi:hypothetical protein